MRYQDRRRDRLNSKPIRLVPAIGVAIGIFVICYIATGDVKPAIALACAVLCLLVVSQSSDPPNSDPPSSGPA